MQKYTDAEIRFIDRKLKEGVHPRAFVDELSDVSGIPRSWSSLESYLNRQGIKVGQIERHDRKRWGEDKSKNKWTIECNDTDCKTVQEVLDKAEVDLDIWEVDRAVVGVWDVTMKLRRGTQDIPIRSQNNQIKIFLKRRIPLPVDEAINNLLKKLEDKSPICKLKPNKIKKQDQRNALEICLMDPHYGMRCFPPGADAFQSPEFIAKMVLDSLHEVIEASKLYSPFEQIILPTGNDFFHTDNIWNTTTKGTGQPEAESYHPTFIGGEELMICIIDMLKEIAPVEMYAIPGNHDRTTSFMLGRVMRAYYHNDKNVKVHADDSPYKFHKYGCNLIGYEHGNSVQAVRLAALMANECPEDWAATKHGYREWHLGDQHRKGSSKPSVLEEQGVSVEFLPGLTAPNEWHRLKSYNWQKRGTMAFVWNYTMGPIARLQVNVDRYLNCLMGRK